MANGPPAHPYATLPLAFFDSLLPLWRQAGMVKDGAPRLQASQRSPWRSAGACADSAVAADDGVFFHIDFRLRPMF